ADEFAEDIVVPDPEEGFLPPVLQVLRVGADRAVAVEMAPLPDGRMPVDDDVSVQDAAGPQARPGADDTVGADADVGGDVARRINDGCRVYGHGDFGKRLRTLPVRRRNGNPRTGSGAVHQGAGEFRLDRKVAADVRLPLH